MQKNHGSFQQETEVNAEESVVQCARGGEVISPREMVGYLRAREEGVELPPGMEEHFRACRICGDNWEFILRTDPVIRQYREERVELVIRHVLAEEVILATPANRESDLPAGEREAKVQTVQEELMQVGVPEKKHLKTILKCDELPSSTIISMCEKVRKIEDDRTRYEESKKLSSQFDLCVKRRQANDAIVEAIFETLMLSDADSIDLSDLKITPEVTAGMAAAFIASFPQTIYFRDPVLLERRKSGKSGGTVLFHRGRFPELTLEFDKVRAKFDAPVSAPGRII
jgi:hypothetical protein